MMLALRMEEGDHEPANGGDLKKLEKTRKWILFQNPRKGGSPAFPYPDFSQVRPKSDS